MKWRMVDGEEEKASNLKSKGKKKQTFLYSLRCVDAQI